MKKVYLLTMFMVFAEFSFGQINLSQVAKENNNTERPVEFQSRSQGDTIVTNDFSNNSLWNTPIDSGGYQWDISSIINSDMFNYIGGMASTTASNGFASFNGISLLLGTQNNISFNAQNTLLEYIPMIDCSSAAAVLIQFEQRYRAYNTDSTIVEISGDNGSTWTRWVINTDNITNASAVQETVSLNISSVATGSSTVKVRFRWIGTGDQAFGAGYGWMIDDFMIIEAWNYEAELVSPIMRSGVGGDVWATGLEYHMIPYNQITAIEFSGKIKNNGGLIQTGAYLSADITGVDTYSAVSGNSNIAVDLTDTFAIMPTYTPSNNLGIRNLSIAANQTNPDHDPTNDSLNTTIEVTSQIYARDNGIIISSINNINAFTGLNFAVGNLMQIFNNAYIQYVDITITNDSINNVGQVIYGKIFKYDYFSGIYVEVANTIDHTITVAELGTAIRIPIMQGNLPVSAGDGLCVLAGHYGSTVRFATAQPVEQGTVKELVSGSVTLSSHLTNQRAIMVRLVLATPSGLNKVEKFNVSVNQNVPNPFNENTKVSYLLNENLNVILNVVDITGKIITTYNQGVQNTGSHFIIINGDVLTNGVYFYTLIVGDHSVTKRMVVRR